MLLSYEQYEATTQIFIIVFPFLSVLGSSILLYLLQREYNFRGRFIRPTYSRLLWNICCIDVVFSTAMLLGRLLVPSSKVGVYTSGYGTVGTCTAQGLVLIVGAGCIAIYNASLMVYFVLRVKYRLTEDQISKVYEPWFHRVVVLAVLVFGISGLVLRVFAPKIILLEQEPASHELYRDWAIHGNRTNHEMNIVVPFCLVGAYPNLCDYQVTQGSGVECERGGTSNFIYFYCCLVAIGTCLVIIFGCLIVLYLKIRAVDQEINRSNTGSSSNHNKATSVLSNKVATQALYYGVFFINTFLWVALGGLLKNDGAAELLSQAFNCSQGIFNLCVYMKQYIEPIRNETRERRDRRRRRRRPHQQLRQEPYGDDDHHHQQEERGIRQEERKQHTNILTMIQKSIDQYNTHDFYLLYSNATTTKQTPDHDDDDGDDEGDVNFVVIDDNSNDGNEEEKQEEAEEEESKQDGDDERDNSKVVVAVGPSRVEDEENQRRLPRNKREEPIVATKEEQEGNGVVVERDGTNVFFFTDRELGWSTIHSSSLVSASTTTA